LANIKQQKKRIKRAEKQHDTNVRYRSTIKTLFKGLESAESTDDAATRARDLEKLVDRAASRGAIHANNAARKKGRIQRILASREA
jgi:small subunit ribosomal protein S20